MIRTTPAFRALLAVIVIICAVYLPAAAAAEHTVAPVGAEYSTIHAAVDQALPGDTITVESGIYYENVRLNKTLSLIGIDSGNGSPVIDPLRKGNAVEVSANGCAIEGFVIQNSELLSGIRITSTGNIIRKNSLLNNAQGILLISSAKNTIAGNNISGSGRYGISLQDSGDNTLIDNSLMKNTVGIALDETSNTNRIYRNNFMNTQNVLSKSTTSEWTSPASLSYKYLGRKEKGRMGNYWSDYHGRDAETDGIGDSPYMILNTGSAKSFASADASITDSAPLMDPREYYFDITSVEPGTEVPTSHPTATITLTSTISPEKTSGAPTSTTRRPVVTQTSTPGAGTVTKTGTSSPFGVQTLVIVAVLLAVIGGAILYVQRKRAIPPEDATGDSIAQPLDTEDSSRSTASLTVQVPDTNPAVNSMTGPYTSAAEQKNYFPRELENKYTDIEYVGRGGIAWVFAAQRKTDDQKVAIKIPISFDEMTGRSFLNEIKAWETLRHKNIVEVSAVNILPVPYVEMEYVPGSLEAIAKPVPVWKAVHIIRGIADALSYAHQHGFIHRDIKPHNVLLTEDLVPKITDWGMSKVLAADVKHSSIAGFSLSYAAPEQVSPSEFGRTDERTDIYQLGVVFYELVTGSIPFGGESIVEVGNAILREQPIHPSEFNPEASAVEKIILKCLEKDPTLRYQSAAEVLDALSRYLDEDEE